LIAYGDVSSARQAMTGISRMLQTSHPHCYLQPMLWRFDQLLKETWHEMALRDARRASLLALTVTNEAALADLSEAWLGALLDGSKGHQLHVLVMVGDTEPWTITLEQPLVKLRVDQTRQQKMPLDQPVKMPGRARRTNQAAAVAA